jgi:hypothetical protein
MSDQQFANERLQNIAYATHHLLTRFQKLADQMFYEVSQKRRESDKNPLVRAGLKCFSQTDEDGITLEIINRINPANKTYLELGPGNGLENNTLILAALGWKGVWIGGEDLAWNYTVAQDRLLFIKQWVNVDVIPGLLATVNGWLGDIDVVSIDFDGNDFWIAQAMLEHGARPAVFIVEYSAKFPPEVVYTMPYNPTHEWDGSDYFGASLAAFNLLFQKHNYTLVACNSQTGANAFFVHTDHISKFDDCPRQLKDLYQPPRYFDYTNYGHEKSAKTVESLFTQPGNLAP